MKLDQETKFAWQQHTHERREVPSIHELLQLFDWRAQASEIYVSIPLDAERKHSIIENKTKPQASYQVGTE